jgi:hypothetical protein
LSTKGRGETAVVDIADHACRWEQTVVANVRIPVEASGGGEEDKAAMLGERELYLSVYQVRSQERRRPWLRAAAPSPRPPLLRATRD